MIGHEMLVLKEINLPLSIILKRVNKKKVLLSMQKISEDWTQKVTRENQKVTKNTPRPAAFPRHSKHRWLSPHLRHSLVDNNRGRIHRFLHKQKALMHCLPMSLS